MEVKWRCGSCVAKQVEPEILLFEHCLYESEFLLQQEAMWSCSVQFQLPSASPFTSS